LNRERVAVVKESHHLKSDLEVDAKDVAEAKMAGGMTEDRLVGHFPSTSASSTLDDGKLEHQESYLVSSTKHQPQIPVEGLQRLCCLLPEDPGHIRRLEPGKFVPRLSVILL
jgi:hypothetical protein